MPALRLYQPLDYFLLRAPLLPVECYRTLACPDTGQDYMRPISLAEQNPAIRRALMVGSVSLSDALDASLEGASHRETYLSGKILRYLIRMSTRPTPFGMFAGIALGS